MMGLCGFSSAKVGNRVHRCTPKEYTLWLRHTTAYSHVNAYNLAVMATLAYSDVRTDKEHKADRDVKDFIEKCADKMKLTVIKKYQKKETVSVNPFMKEVEKGKGINADGTGYVRDTATSTEAFWFVDGEHAVLAVRGTQEIDTDVILNSLLSGNAHAPDDAVIDLDAEQVAMRGIRGQVHRGFATQANAVIGTPSFDDFMRAAQGKKLFVTGHSLGAAVATILSAYLKEKGFDPLLYTYGSPRVGNETFVKAYVDITHYRHVYHHDIVPLVPGRNLDMGIPELNLCAKGGLVGGMGNPVLTLATLSSSLYLCSKNWSGPGYYHHGNLCQIISAGSRSIMRPFGAHNIVAERIRKLLQRKKEAIAHLHAVKHERVDSDHSGISTPLEWYRHYRRVDDANERLQDANDALAALPDDRNDDYSLMALIDGEVSDHFMDVGYLPFLKNEIKTEWRIYKENHCKESAVSDNPSSLISKRIDTAIERVKKEIQEHKKAIAMYDHELAMLNQAVENAMTLPSSSSRYNIMKYRDIEAKLLEKTQEDLQRLYAMKQMRIGSYSLYGLRKGELALSEQLEKFV